MANVTGIIGSDNVELDNAATEETLKKLLAATNTLNQSIIRVGANSSNSGGGGGAGSQQTTQQTNALNQGLQRLNSQGLVTATGALMAMGGAVGMVAKGLGFFGGVVAGLGDAVSGLAGDMIDGQGKLSDFFNSFNNIPVVGIFTSLFGKIIQLQEAELETYRNLTTAGVNFGGQLQTLRKDALGLGLTLDQYGELMLKHSATFAKLGGSTNDGAEAFVRLAKQMRDGRIGEELRGLGLTSQQASDGLATYMELTGGRTSEELKNSRALTTSAGAYMKELDLLAQMTGTSREELEKQQKEQAKNAAWQSYLAGLDEKGKERANNALALALAKGGKGAADALQSHLLGIPPLTEAGKMFTATAGKGVDAIKDMADAVGDNVNGAQRIDDATGKLVVGMANAGKQYSSQTLTALTIMGGATGTFASQTLNAQRELKQKGIETEEQYAAYMRGIRLQQEAQSKSAAAQAAEAEKNFKDMGAAMYGALQPALEQLTPKVTELANTMMDFVIDYMPEIEKAITKIVNAVTTFARNMFSDEGRQLIQQKFEVFMDRLILGIQEYMGKSWLGSLLGGKSSEKGPRGQKSEVEREREKIDARSKELDAKQETLSQKQAVEDAARKQARQDKSNAGQPAGGGVATGKSSKLLEQIAKGEGTDTATAQQHGLKSGYDASLDYGAYGGGPNKDISSMTMAEVKKYQAQMLKDPKNKLNSSAVGKYQFISGTLAELQKEAGLKDTDTFDAATQDRLGEMLLKRRGQDQYNSGKISKDEFQRRLSKEWASVADPNTKKSAYGQHTGSSDLAMKEAIGDKQAANGGFFAGPRSGYNVQLHGKELVIPMNDSKQVSKSAIDPGALTKEGHGANSAFNSGAAMPAGLEMLVSELQTLNKHTTEMIRWARETADHTRRTVDATKSLNGNLFA